MNDLIVAIHGAIAELVADDPERAEIAARFMPIYAEADGAGWFDYARELQGELGDGEASFRPLDEALVALAASPDDDAAHPPSLPAQARLLLAVAMLARLDPERDSDERHTQYVGALRPAVLANDLDRANELLRLLADDEVFPSVESWPSLISVAVEAHLLSADLVDMSPTCTCGTVVITVDGHLVEVAELVTDCPSTEVSLDQVKAVLDPLNWHDCCEDHFCRVTDLGPGSNGWSEMLEEVSLRCSVWSPIKTGIKYFKFELSDGAAGVHYDLIKPQPAGADGQVIVDQGGIVARPLPGGGVRVRSTKQVRFARNGLTVWMATFACLAGWNDVGQQMLFGCARNGGGIRAWTTSEADLAAAAAATGAPVTGDPPPAAGGDLGQRIDGSVARMRTEIDQLASAWVAYLGRAEGGAVTAEDLATMTGDLAARSVREALRSSDLARRVVERRTTKVPQREREDQR